MSYGKVMAVMRAKRGQGQNGGSQSRQGGNGGGGNNGGSRNEYRAEYNGGSNNGGSGGNGAGRNEYRAEYNGGPNNGWPGTGGGGGRMGMEMHGPAYPRYPRYPLYEEARYGGNESRYNGNEPRDAGSEMAFRDRRGRKHYDNGRYAPMRNAYGDEKEEDDMPIGFDMSGNQPGREMGRASVYENGAGGWDVQGTFGRGQQDPKGSERMTKEMAEMWTSRMHNKDGNTGPHWTMEQVRQLQQQKKELQEFDLPEIFAVINLMYSMFCKTAQKFNVNTVDFYTALAVSWLDDKDAGEGKTAKYFEHVVR